MKVKTISVLTLLWVFVQVFANIATGQYLDETTETNINKVDPLFERSVPDLKEFKAGIDQDKRGIIEQIGNNTVSPIADSDKIANERVRLESLNVHELDSKAREEFARDPFHNEMFAPLNRPGMQAHLEDAKKIAKGSSKMINNIIANLKVICQHFSGQLFMHIVVFLHILLVIDSH